jgi:hypothetical protein
VVQAPDEGGVEVLLAVGREDRHPFVGLDALQQIADLHVRVALVSGRDVGPFPEQRVRLVEEQDGSAFRGFVEDPAQSADRKYKRRSRYVREVRILSTRNRASGAGPTSGKPLAWSLGANAS